MADSPRWCETCQKHGDHHTDRCPTVSARPSHDAYVYKTRSRWTWNCPCGAIGSIYSSRIHADVAAETHANAASPPECPHCGAIWPVPCDDAPEQAHPSAASPLCSCGARAVEDGGTEGRCECCSGCERMSVSNGNDIEPKGDGVSSDLNAEGRVVTACFGRSATGRCKVKPAWMTTQSGGDNAIYACGRHLTWLIGLRTAPGAQLRVVRLVMSPKGSS